MTVDPGDLDKIPDGLKGTDAVTAVQAATKTCRTCGATKNIADFPRKSANRDGVGNACKECESERVRAWQALKMAEDPEAFRRRRADNQRRRRADPDARERDRMHQRAQNLAVSRLKELHAGSYRHLLDVARREVGL